MPPEHTPEAASLWQQGKPWYNTSKKNQKEATMAYQLNRLNDVFFKYLLGDSKKEIPDVELYQRNFEQDG